MNHRVLTPAILAATLALGGCSRREVPLTEDQKATLRQEVIQAMKPVWAACEKMDPTVMRFTQNTPDFGFATSDGKVYSHGEFSKVWGDMVSQFPSQKLDIRNEKVIVLAHDAALYCWQGVNDVMLKDGTVLRADPMSGAYLLRKVDGAWLGIHYQESGPAPTPLKPVELTKK